MTANIIETGVAADRVVYSGQSGRLNPAWHGLGLNLPDRATITHVREALERYLVQQARGYVPYDPETGRIWTPADKSVQPPAGLHWFATEAMFNFRSDIRLPDRSACLSPSGVGEAYEVVQNSELIDLAEAIIGESGATVETCGTLAGGAHVWILLDLSETDGYKQASGTDRKPYLLIYAGHDGSYKIVVALTTVRVVCNNTLNVALSEIFQNRYEFRHTANVRDRIARAASALSKAHDYFEKESLLFQSMSRKAVDERFLEAFTLALWPDPIKADGKPANSTRAVKKRDQIKSLASGKQAGSNDPGMKTDDGNLSAYGLYNAVSQYLQHDSTVRATGEFESTDDGQLTDKGQADKVQARSEQRLRSTAMGGYGEQQRGLALQTILRHDELMEQSEEPLKWFDQTFGSTPAPNAQTVDDLVNSFCDLN